MNKKRNMKPNSKGEFKKDSECNDTADPRNYTQHKNSRKGGHVSRPNDIAWYSKNPALLEAASRVSFGNIQGAGQNWEHSNGEITKYVVPGIMVIHTVPMYGKLVDDNSPMTRSARLNYTITRTANSGATNYADVDQQLYFMATDNVYSFFEWAKRLYRSFWGFSPNNNYLPEALVGAHGIRYGTAKNRLADFEYWLQNYCVELNRFGVPATMPIFDRHRWMYSHIYLDSDQGNKQQIYMFQPDGFYTYDQTSSERGGMLKFKRAPWADGTSVFDIDVVFQYGEELMRNLYKSGDISTMRGDIVKAFGQNLIRAEAVRPYEHLEPRVITEVAEQIHNLHSLDLHSYAQGNGITSFYSSLDITQNDDIATSTFFEQKVKMPKAEYMGNGNLLLQDRMLNLLTTDTSAAHVVEATRLMSTWTHVGDDLVLKDVGSELVTDVAIVKMIDYDGRMIPSTGWVSTFINLDSTTANIPALVEQATRSGVFNHRPMIYYEFTSPMTNKKDLNIDADLRSYTKLEHSILSKINDTAVISLFGL